MLTFQQYVLQEWPWSKPPELTPEQRKEYDADAERLWLLRNDFSGQNMHMRRGQSVKVARAAVVVLMAKRELEARKIVDKWKRRGHSIRGVKPESKKGWIERKTNGWLRW